MDEAFWGGRQQVDQIPVKFLWDQIIKNQTKKTVQRVDHSMKVHLQLNYILAGKHVECGNPHMVHL